MKKIILKDLVALALAEDVGYGDITTESLVPKDSRCRAKLIFKTPGVLCGLKFAQTAFKLKDPKAVVKGHYRDGQLVTKGEVVATIYGRTQAVLTAERVAVNFLSYLSSIATTTRHFVDAVKPYHPDILDTRKTTPLLRVLDRYAVRIGGGRNHRFDLSSMGMIKDNHYYVDQDPVKLVELLKKKTNKRIVLEVDSLEQLKAGLRSKADIILLDNMDIASTRKAVKLRDNIAPSIKLESSGGINLKSIKSYAACGVERISVGSLTQQRSAIDISLEIDV